MQENVLSDVRSKPVQKPAGFVWCAQLPELHKAVVSYLPAQCSHDTISTPNCPQKACCYLQTMGDERNPGVRWSDPPKYIFLLSDQIAWPRMCQ